MNPWPQSSSLSVPGPPPRRAWGFTLVELTVVIAIIAVLVSILVPSFRRSMREASATVCLHNLREIGRGLHEYRLDHKGWLPVVSPADGLEPPEPAEAAWYGRLVPKYLAMREVLICPSDPADRFIRTGGPIQSHRDPANLSSYGMNELIRAAGLWNLDRVGPSTPLETILLADAGPDNVVGGLVARNNGWLPWDDGFHIGTLGLRDSWLTGRHFGHINVLTVGGAVQRISTERFLHERIVRYYGDCAAGGCTLCVAYSVPHYSFASSRLYWWTGTIHNQVP